MEALVALFVVGFVSAITPGPDILLVLRNTVAFGIRRGFIVLGGIASGWIVYLVFVYFGLTHFLSHSIAQIILSVIGCVYLGYISFTIYTSTNTPLPQELAQKNCSKNLATGSASNANDSFNASSTTPDTFLRALFVNLSNPKAILFFAVIVTQFIGETLLLSIVVLFCSIFFAFVCVIMAGGFFRQVFNERALLWVDRVSGVLFLMFACLLAYNAVEIAKKL